MATDFPAIVFMASWVTLVVLVLAATVVLRGRHKCRARKERELGSRKEEGRIPLQGGMARRRVLLRPLRRESPVAQKYIKEPVRRPALAWTRPGVEIRNSYGRAVAVASFTHSESRRYSMLIPDAGVRGRVALTRSDFIHPDSQSAYRQAPDGDSRTSLLSAVAPRSIHFISTLPVSPSVRRYTLHPASQSTYRQTPGGDDRASLPSVVAPRAIHPVWTAPVSPSARRHTLSSGTGSRASLPSTTCPDSIYPVSTLPSYPGTAWSASPPAYSDLSRTPSGRTLGGSSRGVSFRDESAVEPMPDLRHLEEGRGRA